MTSASLPLVLLAATCSQVSDTSYESANFIVHAASSEIAKQVGIAAERYRVKLAKRWLGDKRVSNWPSPCRIDVTLNLEKIEGVTSISFLDGGVASLRIRVKGPLDRILTGPLPHELTHALFAHHFGFQAPRWADEGAAILSEDGTQGERQTRAFGQILADERTIPLRRFLAMNDYPADMGRLYAQGHSVCRFMVTSKGHGSFLAFVRDGLENGWDASVRAHFGYKDVETMEDAWMTWASRQARTTSDPGATATINAGQSHNTAMASADRSASD